jgi:plasmid stabilization system protein ParE
MPIEVAFSKGAQRQLSELESYLSKRFYPANAERYIDRLLQTCRSLGHAPYRGTERSDLRPGIRVIGFESKAAIYFKLVESRVVILGILYGGRQPSSELRP